MSQNEGDSDPPVHSSSSRVLCDWKGSDGKLTTEDIVESFLPENYSYKVVSCDIVESSSFLVSDVNFDLKVRVNVLQVDDVKGFLSSLNDSSGCSFNIKSGCADRRQAGPKARTLIRGYRKCCLNVHSTEGTKAQQVGKNTNCGAGLHFRFDTPASNSPDSRLEKEMFPLFLNLHFNHNHSLSRADYYKYLDVSDETKAFFDEMFHQGKYIISAEDFGTHSPA